MALETKLIGSVGIDLKQFAADTNSIKKSLDEVSKVAKTALQFNLSIADKDMKAFRSEIQKLIDDFKKLQGYANAPGGGAVSKHPSTGSVAQANALYSEMINKMRQIMSLQKTMSAIPPGDPSGANLQKEISDQETRLGNIRQTISAVDDQTRASSRLVNARSKELEFDRQLETLRGKDTWGASKAKEAQGLLTQMTTAYRNMNAAIQQGDVVQESFWRGRAESSKSELDNMHQVANLLPADSAHREKIVDSINKAEIAQTKQTTSTQETNKASANLEQSFSRILKYITTMIIVRGLREMWRDATQYAKEYYDSLNEIRIVTGMTEKQADALGASYRKLAREMRVSSTEIAKAAVEYWRQGLDENEVNDRMKSTIQYGKISGLSFEESAEIVTSSVNTMEISARRAVDVFSYQGDATAAG